jgi:hypothetical protein
MNQDVAKICADSLRTFSKEKYDITLKAAHAHELVAAYFGYKSKRAMKADTKYPMSNFHQAEIIVMISDDFIDQRRKNLHELSPELPDSYTLGEEVYAPLFEGELWTSQYPPFRSFKTLAKYIVENFEVFRGESRFNYDIPMEHFVVVNDEDSDVILTVTHTYRAQTGELKDNGDTIIKLPRIAGRIGYGRPQITPVIRSGGARRKIKIHGVQS